MDDTISVINVNDFSVLGTKSAFMEEFGLGVEEALRKRCCEITKHRCAPEENIPYDCPLKETIATGEPASAEHVHYGKDGAAIHMEVSTYPLKDGNGRIAQIIHVTREVTAKKRAHAKLIKKHEELDKLFKLVERIKEEWERTLDCTADMIILIDEDNRIKRCNRALKEFTGKPYEEIIQQDCRSLLAECGIVATSFNHGTTELFCEGNNRWYIIQSHPFKKADATVSGSVILVHDSTNRKKITLELEAKNKELEDAYAQLKATQVKVLQQEKMASIGQLAAGVAHEINNPVGFITRRTKPLRGGPCKPFSRPK